MQGIAAAAGFDFADEDQVSEVLIRALKLDVRGGPGTARYAYRWRARGKIRCVHHSTGAEPAFVLQ
jgi:hypothetical protein